MFYFTVISFSAGVDEGKSLEEQPESSFLFDSPDILMEIKPPRE